MTVELSINGERCSFDVDSRISLLDLLRDHCRLTGAKSVCREGFCGACMVLVDGQAVPSCLRPIGLLQGAEIVTIEGIAPFENPNAVQQVLLDHDVVQCGMCFPGMVITLTSFIKENPTPSRQDVKSALTGNICRCTGYERIIDAIMFHLERSKAALP